MVLPGQAKIARFYNSRHIQTGVAVLISANFLTNIVEKEIDPHGEKYKDVFAAFELFYNICFTIELGINFYSHWFKQFWKSKWNIFDVVVVSIGIINTLKLPLPPACAMLRMIRAFKVMKLFNRIHSLNKIVVAIIHAIPGVCNAFLILGIVMSIYAILATEFYYKAGDDCHQVGGDVRFLTQRGYCVGEEYFGTFTKSLYSFFQVLTGESWSEAVARPAIWFYYDDPIRAVGGGLFFVSYVLITAFVLTNVVVAVLLDKMVDTEVADEAKAVHPESTMGESIYHPRDEDAAIEGEEGTVPNGVESSAVDPTPENLKSTISEVNSQIDQLLQEGERDAARLGSFRTEMTSLREQMAIIVQCLPGNPNKIADSCL